MTEYTPAIVLSHGQGGLGTLRSLARRGVNVTAIAYEADDPVLYSRYPSNVISVPGVSHAAKESNLLTILDQLPESRAVIITTSDRLVSLISRNYSQLRRKYQFKLPPPEMLDALNDKRKETEMIRSLRIPIPKTVVDISPDPATLAGILSYPIIFKPHSFSAEHVFPDKNAIVHNDAELNAFYEKWKHALQVLIAQEVIPGPDSASWVCSCTFDDNHTLLDCGVKQKLRALPAHFGGSTFAISRYNSDVIDLARQIGRELNYVGHAGIEFRWDERDNDYKYIELNPRIPANVGFDEACGLPTAWNSYQVATSKPVIQEPRRQKDGIYYLDMKRDLYSMRADGTSLIAIVATFSKLLVFKRTNGPYFAWTDPMPGIVVAMRYLRSMFGSRWKKAKSKYVPRAKA